MQRMSTTQAYENDQRDILPIILGGTGVTIATNAPQALGGISVDSKDTPNGVAQLDENSKILISELDFIPGVEMPNIGGSNTVYTSTSPIFTITNFDSQTEYTLSAIHGMLTIIGNEITYEAPATPCVEVIKVNNNVFGISVIASHQAKPTISTPANNAINVALRPVIQLNPIVWLGYQDTVISIEWEVTEVNQTPVVITTTDGQLHWQPVDPLLLNTQYSIRVRVTGTILGIGEWSDPITFTTTASAIPASEFAQLHSFPGPLVNGVTGYQPNNYGSYVVDISRDGNVVVTSDPNAFLLGLGNTVGRVLIYNYSNGNWIQNSIEPNVLDLNTWFGKQIAISADKQKIVVVSQFVGHDFPAQQGYNGEIRIYQTSTPDDYSNMVLLATYVPSTSIFLSANIGQDISTTPNFETIAVSGYNDYLYVFNFDGVDITLSATINKTTNGSNGFGETISINEAGTTLVVGSEYGTINNINSTGSFHIYDLNNEVWSLTQVIEADDTADPLLNERYFGWPVVISPNGGKIATFSNTWNDNTGHVYLFEKVNNVWTKTKKHDMPEMRDDQLGGEISTMSFNGDGTLLLAGSPWQANPVSVIANGSWDDTGMCYLFDVSLPEISLVRTYIASDSSNGIDGEQYGSQIAISYDSSTVAITSPWRNWNADPVNLGTIYVYR